MRNDDSLNVWYEEKLVGTLWQNAAGLIGFQYESNWIKNGFPISQQLPLTEKEYPPTHGKAHQFFANLLPEANARLHIVRNLKIADSDFALLKAIGGECAGALSILPMDYKRDDAHHYKKLTINELKKTIQQKGLLFNLNNKHRPRLSLAGAQDKCPIFFEDDNYFLPQDAAPSTHILKFEIAGYRNVPVYEYFLTQLAHSIGLPVVDIELKQCDQDYFLLIKRYDRILTGPQQVQRLHQEDFCQALGVRYDKKYQQDGGPSFQDCYQLIQQISTQPLHDVEQLLKWQIFNVLGGNSDGHAKNLAILYKKNHTTELAPFYDLVCTRAIEGIDIKLALSVGGEFNPANITARHWQLLAKECEVRYPFLKKMIQETAETLIAKYANVMEDFENTFGSYPALQRIHKVVTKQCKRILNRLNT